VLTEQNRIDINRFFKVGYTSTQIDKSIADKLLAVIKTHNFVNPEVTQGREDSFYNVETQIFHSTAIPRSTVLEGDESVSPLMGEGFKTKEDWQLVADFWNQLLNQHTYFEWFRKNFGNFTQISKQACAYPVNSGFSFHSHTRDTVFLINVLYLGDGDFTADDGGYIEFGKCNFDNEGTPDFESLDYRGKVLPNHGTLATFCNLDPGFMHAVHRLYRQKTRYSLIAQCGFSEHMVTALGRKNWNVI